jgi:hypothetical protein
MTVTENGLGGLIFLAASAQILNHQDIEERRCYLL